MRESREEQEQEKKRSRKKPRKDPQVAMDRAEKCWPLVLFFVCIMVGVSFGLGVGIYLGDNRPQKEEKCSQIGAVVGPAITVLFVGLPIYFAWRKKEDEELYQKFPHLRPSRPSSRK